MTFRSENEEEGQHLGIDKCKGGGEKKDWMSLQGKTCKCLQCNKAYLYDTSESRWGANFSLLVIILQVNVMAPEVLQSFGVAKNNSFLIIIFTKVLVQLTGKKMRIARLIAGNNDCKTVLKLHLLSAGNNDCKTVLKLHLLIAGNNDCKTVLKLHLLSAGNNDCKTVLKLHLLIYTNYLETSHI